MAPKLMRILHLEDNPGDAALVRELVVAEWPDADIRAVSTPFAYTGELHLGDYDLILSDFTLTAFNGMDALRLAKQRAPEIPFMFLSGTIGEDRAIEALQAGAEDYVIKDRMKRLIPAIHRVLRENEERRKRLQAERQIREQAEMLNHATEALIITDLANRVVYWNGGAGRLLGWTGDEALGKSAVQLFGPSMLAQLESANATTDEQGEWHGEIQFRDRQGGALIVETRQTLIRDEAGRPKARLSILSDVTEKKRLEEQFLRAQRMENIGLLSAGIAHDLNNMLAPILMAAPLLREAVTGAGPLRLLEILEQSAERGAALVRQILAFSHGAGGGHRLIQVKHLLRDIAAVIESTFPKAIRLEEHRSGDLWPIQANPTQIHQVVLNLCVNARDAMPQGGTLTLRTENLVLDAAAAAGIDGGRAGAFLVVEVADTGTGIAPEVLARMWEPFFTTKEPGKGTGLGLSTVRGIVKNHEGFVTLHTVVGEGARFRIYLPAAEASQTDSAHPHSKALPRGSGELILVVDDEQYIREMTATMLTSHGYRALLAADGTEAVMLFGRQAEEIRLVVTDLNMPNLDGALLAAAMKRINPDVKILVMSGGVERTNGNGHGQRASPRPQDFAAGFLPKPFKPEKLLTTVHELLHPRA